MDVELLDHQYEFLNDETKFTLLCGGIGSGKSWVGAHWIINRVVNHPDVLHFIGTNTFSQLRDSTLACLFGVLSELGITFTFNQNKGLLTFGGGKVLCRSLENFNVLRGIEIGSFWLDEVRDLKREAFDMLMGRLRAPNCPDLKGRLTSSPAGFNWLHDYFHHSGSSNTPDFNMITATTYNNPFLPDGYIDTLKAQYSEAFFQQEVMAEFINITTGRVYYGFRREGSVTECDYKRIGSLYVGMDFNVDPMSAVLCEFYDGKLHIIDEFFLRNSNTFEMCREIKKKYPNKIIKIIPDSTGKNRKTSGRSDHDILRNEFGSDAVVPTRNPHVMDRVNNVNRLLEEQKIIIDPRCKKLINDLEKVTWVEGKSQLNQTDDKLLTHISDSLGYLAWKLVPIQSGNRGVTITIT